MPTQGQNGTTDLEPAPLVPISSIQDEPASYGENQYSDKDISPRIGQAASIGGIAVGDFQVSAFFIYDK